MQRAPGVPCALSFEGRVLYANLGRNAPRDREVMFAVIACDKREAFCARERLRRRNPFCLSLRGGMDCFASLAMTEGMAHSRDPLARNDVEEANPDLIAPQLCGQYRGQNGRKTACLAAF